MGKGLGTIVGLAMLDALYKRDTYTAYRIRHEYHFIIYCEGYFTLKVPFTLAELSGKQAYSPLFFLDMAKIHVCPQAFPCIVDW